MNRMRERVAYLKGLAEGLEVAKSSAEGRVLAEVLDLLDEMIMSIDNLQFNQEQVEEYITAIDDDLTDLEADFYEEDYIATEEMDLSDSDDELEELGYIEMSCPNCNETVYVDKDFFEDDDIVEVLCPECNATILVNDDMPAYSAE